MNFEGMAQELVEATSTLVGGRTINVMNTDGIIIASTEKHRIGTFHAGAKWVIDNGKPLAIEKKQVILYPGSKEGYNLPIKSGDSIIGVVGIFGNPEDIMDLAHLLEVYAAKYFELEALMQQRLIESEARNKLLHMLLSMSAKDKESAAVLLNMLQVRLQFPLRVLVISSEQNKEEQTHFLLEKPVERLREAGLIEPSMDLWGIADEHLVIIRSNTGAESPVFWKRFLDCLEQEPVRCCLTVGGICQSLEEIRGSYQEASLLNEYPDGSFYDMMNLNTQCDYLLWQTVKQNQGIIAELDRKMQDSFNDDEREMLLGTIACYYDENRSVTQAAAKLFIHKNTLQYRIRRVMEALNFTEYPGFYQEYLIRLLIRYEQCKKGPRT